MDDVDVDVVDVTDLEDVPEVDVSGLKDRMGALQAYMRSISRYPLLNADEEHTLAVRFVQTRAPSLAHKLVNANLRLVVKIAREYHRSGSNLLDLIQEGNYGMVRAVEKFDPERGVKLSSYGAFWIRAYILRYILDTCRSVKIGTTQAQRKLFFNLKREKAKLVALGYEPTPERVAQRLGVSAKEVSEMDLRLAAVETSLDAPIGESDGHLTTRGDMLVAEGQPADTVLDRERFRSRATWVIGKFRQTLDGKDMLIFEHRMLADDPLTLQELGDEFGISRERVRQLESNITRRLKVFAESHMKEDVRGA